MIWQQPLFLWSLLCLIPLIGLYFLRIRPRRQPTTAIFLWQQILVQNKRSALWHRLRDVWSLLLMIIAASAICLAMAGPQWREDRSPDLLLVIDQSGSMNAHDGSQTRLDRAKEAARRVVTALDGHQRAAVATVGRELQFHSHFSDHPHDLLDAIDAIPPAFDEADIGQLVPLVRQLSAERELRVLLFSDGCVDEESVPQGIEMFKVGSPQENLGIVGADLRLIPGAPRALGLFLQIYSSYSSPRSVDVEIVYVTERGNELFKLLPLTVQPGVNKPLQTTIASAQHGRWQVRLRHDDQFSTDNVAYLTVPKSNPIPVQVVADDRFFLENSVRAFSDDAGLLRLVSTQEEDQDSLVTLSQGQIPITDSPQRLIIFRPSGESDFWRDLGDEIEVVPKVVAVGHPVLRYIEPESIAYAGARALTVPEGTQIWVESDGGVPLIFQARRANRAAIVINLDPTQADFYFSAWFPVLVHASAVWLVGREMHTPSTVAVGTSIELPKAGQSDWHITSPTGALLNARDRFRANQPGFFHYRQGETAEYTGCSLLSVRESQLDNENTRSSNRPLRHGTPPAIGLTWLALGVVLMESLLYYRRKVG